MQWGTLVITWLFKSRLTGDWKSRQQRHEDRLRGLNQPTKVGFVLWLLRFQSHDATLTAPYPSPGAR